jgi:N-carbamoylputrescine amidase
MKIALAQQRADADREANLSRALAVMGRARKLGAELIVFPELAIERFFPQHSRDAKAKNLAEPIPGRISQMVSDRARELSLVTIFNMYESVDASRFFDCSPVFDADGRLLGVTRMVHITDYEGFHEREYYHPGDRGAPVYETRVGRIAVCICYDRHFPEYTRALGLAGAELVVIPQAGTIGEWPEGMYEAEVRTASLQNGYFTALCNRVGVEDQLSFSGESFVVDPEGQVLARGKAMEEDLVVVDLDLTRCARSTARRLFWKDRRPELYKNWLEG